MDIRPGRYRHFKGNTYDVIGIAAHSETLEEYVVYKDELRMWIRPVSMFFEEVTINGKKIPRFTFIKEGPI